MSLATSLLDDNLRPSQPYRNPTTVQTPLSETVPTATRVAVKVKAVKVKAVQTGVKVASTGRHKARRNHAKPHAHPVAYNAHTGNGARQTQGNSVRLTELVRDVLYPECGYDGGYEERKRADVVRSQAARKARKQFKLKAKIAHGFVNLSRENKTNWAVA